MSGYTELLKHDEGFLEAWELIKIERLSFARMSPEVRFMYGLGVNALAVININKSVADRQPTTMPTTMPPNQATNRTIQHSMGSSSMGSTGSTGNSNSRSSLVYSGLL